jgi:carboxypeptidase C (cathepsin A)
MNASAETGIDRRRLLAGLSLGGALAGGQAKAAEALPDIIPGGRLDASAIVNGRKIDYEVVSEPFLIQDATKRSQATVYTLSYLRKAPAVAGRPVVFAFNGGPGGPSAWLNFAALGPRRVIIPGPEDAGSNAPFAVTDDTSGLLDTADLVFIDPVDTGYSRAVGAADAKLAFFNTEEDGRYFAEIIRNWLSAHGRDGAPIHIVGESFGCTRATVVAHWLTGEDPRPPVELAGIILVSPGLNFNDVAERHLSRNIVAHCIQLPSIARVAWYHKLASADGRSHAAFLQDVERFAGSEYLSALYQGRSIAKDRAEAVASTLQKYTGVSREYFLAHDLVISRTNYCQEVLRTRGEALAEYDARYVAKVDPSSPDFDPFSSLIGARFSAAVLSELDRIPRPAAPGEYIMMSRDAQKSWLFFNSGMGERPYTRYLETAMQRRKAMRLLIIAGNYDLGAGKDMAEYLVSHSDLPADRMTRRYFEAGHMVYTTEEGRAAFVADIRRMMAA